MKQRVATIITQLELGGAQQIALYTAAHLDAEKYESYFISGEPGILDEKARGTTTFQFYQVPALQRHIRPFQDFTALIKLTILLRKIKPHIVHTHSSKAGIVGRWAAFFARVPGIVHTYHGFGFNDFQPWLVKKIYVLVEQITAWITDTFVVVSTENVTKALREHISTREKYRVIYYGIEKKFFTTAIDVAAKKQSLGIPASARVVGMIACFKPQKAPLDFVKAAALIAQKHDDVYFMMVGDGVLRSDIERYARELTIAHRIVLTGWRNDVEELIKTFDVFLLTSLWEGQPIVLLQSMASHVPIVATAVDGTRELISNGENGFLVECHDTTAMAQHVETLLTTPHLAEQFVRANEGKTFDLDTMVRRIEEVYDGQFSVFCRAL